MSFRNPGTSLPKIPSWLAVALLLAISTLVYLPAVNAGFVWDDVIVHDAPELENFAGLVRIWTDSDLERHGEHYWPILHTTFWIEHQLWGDDPTGYHLVNILLHAANGLLILVLLRRLDVPGSWLIALIFAIHPVHVESVAWVIERKDVLSGFFYLASAIAYFSSDPVLSGRPRAEKGIYGASLALFILAMLTKSVAISLPIALALVLWWKKSRLDRRDLQRLAPFFVLAVVLEIFTGYLMSRSARIEVDLNLLERIIVAGGAIWFYIGKLLWPHPLLAVYPKWEIDATSLAQWMLPVAVVLVLIALWLARKKIGRAPLAAALYFCVTVGPTLGLIPFGMMEHTYVADRFQYLASLGPIAGVVAGVTLLFFRSPQFARAGLAAVVVIGIGLMSVLTWNQAARYENHVTLFSYSLAHNPASSLAWFNMGIGLWEEGEQDEAIDAFKQAMTLDPTNANIFRKLTAYHMERGDPEAARSIMMNLASQWEEDEADRYALLGDIEKALKNYDQAALYYRQALSTQRDNATIWSSLALVLGLTGRQAEAEATFRHAIDLDPNLPQPHNDLGALLLRSGKMDEAAQHFRKALELDPDFSKAHTNLGAVLAQQGRLEEAEHHLTRAVQEDPNLVEALVNLAMVQWRLGKESEAKKHLNKAMRLEPRLAAEFGDIAASPE